MGAKPGCLTQFMGGKLRMDTGAAVNCLGRPGPLPAARPSGRSWVLAMPCLRPSRTMTPLRASIFHGPSGQPIGVHGVARIARRAPRTRDDVVGDRIRQRRAFGAAHGDAFAHQRAHESRPRRRDARCPAGLSSTADTAPALLRQSFFHTAVVKSSVWCASKLACANSARNAAPFSPCGTTRCAGPRCTVRPGARRSAGRSIITGTMRVALEVFLETLQRVRRRSGLPRGGYWARSLSETTAPRRRCHRPWW